MFCIFVRYIFCILENDFAYFAYFAYFWSGRADARGERRRVVGRADARGGAGGRARRVGAGGSARRVGAGGRARRGGRTRGVRSRGRADKIGPLAINGCVRIFTCQDIFDMLGYLSVKVDKNEYWF